MWTHLEALLFLSLLLVAWVSVQRLFARSWSVDASEDTLEGRRCCGGMACDCDRQNPGSFRAAFEQRMTSGLTGTLRCGSRTTTDQ